MGYSPCDRKESDTTEVTENAHTLYEMITVVSLDHTHYLCLYYIPMSYLLPKPPRAEIAEEQAPEIHESGDGHECGCDLMQTILPESLASSAPAPSQPAGQAGCKHLSCLWTEPATAQGPALS